MAKFAICYIAAKAAIFDLWKRCRSVIDTECVHLESI